MKILNLYAGIGGNRKLWKDVDVTAVELNEDIAKVYQDFFPDDEVVVADAHQYLLDHYKEFDFIWSSPPCPTHSQFRYNTGYKADRKYSKVKAKYPDMRLYQEIILLDYWFDGKWIVENTDPYYEPLIPAEKVHRHLVWSNFKISPFETDDERKHGNIKGSSNVYGFSIKDYDISCKGGKRKILRNMVDPKLGLHVLNCAFPEQVELPDDFVKQETLITSSKENSELRFLFNI